MSYRHLPQYLPICCLSKSSPLYSYPFLYLSLRYSLFPERDGVIVWERVNLRVKPWRQLGSVFPRFRASIWRSCGQNACRDLLNQSAGSYWTTDASYYRVCWPGEEQRWFFSFSHDFQGRCQFSRVSWFSRFRVWISCFRIHGAAFHDFHTTRCDFHVFHVFHDFHGPRCECSRFFVIFVLPSANFHAFTIADVDFGDFHACRCEFSCFFAFSRSKVRNYTFFVIFTSLVWNFVFSRFHGAKSIFEAKSLF